MYFSCNNKLEDIAPYLTSLDADTKVLPRSVLIARHPWYKDLFVYVIVEKETDKTIKTSQREILRKSITPLGRKVFVRNLTYDFRKVIFKYNMTYEEFNRVRSQPAEQQSVQSLSV